MTLFLSDLHLGRGTDAESRAAERDAVALLETHEAAVAEALAGERGGGLYLVGDVFNHYLEYPHLVPKGFVRLQGLLARWTDRGLPVTYLFGNRDPWHLGYFEKELGVRLVADDLVETLAGVPTYIAHGDGLMPSERAYNRLRPLLRSPLAYTLYRNAFPGDWAFRLARHVGRRGTGVPTPEADRELRQAARRALTAHRAAFAVLGHAHVPELTSWPEGTYLNAGYWFADRTFGRLSANAGGQAAAELCRWTGSGIEVLAKEAIPVRSSPPSTRNSP